MQKIKTIDILLFLFVFIAFSCSNKPYKNIEYRNLSNLYKPGQVKFKPEFKLFHKTDTNSLLFVKLTPNELSRTIEDDSNKHYFKVKFHYRIFDTSLEQKLIDSASVVLKSYNSGVDEDFVTYIPISLKSKKEYLVEIISTDMVSKSKTQDFIYADKLNVNSSQNFLVTDSESKKPLFTNSINNSESFNLKNQRISTERIYVKFYATEIPSPMPPYFISNTRVLEISVDSIMVIDDYTNHEFKLEKEGIYFFQTDTTQEAGLALFKFSGFYPYIKSDKALLNPLKYLTSFREFKQLQNYNNLKIAVDSFWLNTANDMNKARELIRIFYNRVQLANKYFASYTEGWNTDRGMIYIVLGPPKNVYKYDNMEQWSYGQRTNHPILEFNFIKVKSPFTDNNYALQRNELYSQIWNQAVDTWRSGLVYSIAQ